MNQTPKANRPHIALYGNRNAGKSSLINRLASHELAKVGNLSQSKYKGTHTTTTSRLYHLGNFDLIDSPGVREFGLAKVNPQEVVRGFPEIQSLATNCKFRDCLHVNDEGCNLNKDFERYSFYKEMIESFKSHYCLIQGD